MSRNKIADVFKHYDMAGGDRDRCWLWKGAINTKDGRPYFTADGVRRAAYVWVLIAYTGEMPDGRSGLHSCDNELCGSPYHLRWGTHEENMADIKLRDRSGLTKVQQRAIKKLIDVGRSEKAIAELYGVSREMISAIKHGRGKE